MDPNLSILFPPLKIDNKRMIDALSKGEKKSEWLMRWGILPFVTLFKSMNELASHNGADWLSGLVKIINTLKNVNYIRNNIFFFFVTFC